MNIIETLRLKMFKGVRQFSLDRAATFPASSHAGGLFALVAGAITQIEAKAAAQLSGLGSARDTTATKGFTRGDLEEQIESINRTARAISIQTRGVLEQFRMPSGSSDHALLTAARAFAKAALPLKSEFTKRGLSETFLEDLDHAIKEFEDSINQRHATRESHVAATAGIDAPFEQGMEAVRELKLIMPNLLKNDPEGLAAWTSASHVEHHSSRKGTKSASPGASPGESDNPATDSGKPPNTHV